MTEFNAGDKVVIVAEVLESTVSADYAKVKVPGTQVAVFVPIKELRAWERSHTDAVPGEVWKKHGIYYRKHNGSSTAGLVWVGVNHVQYLSDSEMSGAEYIGTVPGSEAWKAQQ